jgi:hypothetical protein
MVFTCYFFYNDGLIKDRQLRMSMQKGMEAYGGIAPSYIILLREKPTLWWYFHSLHQCIHLTLSFMLADENNPQRMCKHLQENLSCKWYGKRVVLQRELQKCSRR